MAEGEEESQLIVDNYVMAADTLASIDFEATDNIKESGTTPALIPVAEAASKPKVANQIVVNSMKVDARIWEGKNSKTLNNGIWRIPGTSTPDKGGNMVLAAHRWKWLPTSKKSFYDIDKVKIGDEVSVTWEGKTYTYKVISTQVVTPDKVSILSNSKKPKLTLFSCTPLFSTKYRLVVEAELVEPGPIGMNETKSL